MRASRRGFLAALLASPLVACLPEPVPAGISGVKVFHGRVQVPGKYLFVSEKWKRWVEEEARWEFPNSEWRGNVYLPPMEIGR